MKKRHRSEWWISSISIFLSLFNSCSFLRKEFEVGWTRTFSSLGEVIYETKAEAVLASLKRKGSLGYLYDFIFLFFWETNCCCFFFFFKCIIFITISSCWGASRIFCSIWSICEFLTQPRSICIWRLYLFCFFRDVFWLEQPS